MKDETKVGIAGAAFMAWSAICFWGIGGKYGFTLWACSLVCIAIWAVKDSQREKQHKNDRKRITKYGNDAARRAREEEHHGTDRDIF